MKKLLTLLLAAMMLVGMAACAPKEAPPAEGSTPNAGETKKTLRVAMECTYAPYNWTQPDDSNGAVPLASGSYVNGYDVVIAKIIAEKLGYELEIVQTDWSSIIPAIQSGVIDLGICGQSTTPDRKEMVDFTDPYYFATITVLVPEDSKYANATSVADLEGATAMSQETTIWNDVCLPQIPNGKLLPGAETAPAMIVALTSGRTEIVVTDKPTATAATIANPKLKMREFEGEGAFKVSQDDINIGISLKKGSTELREAINGVLAEYTEADFVTMMEEIAAVQPLAQ